MLPRIASRGANFASVCRVAGRPQTKLNRSFCTATAAPVSSTSSMPAPMDSYVDVPMATPLKTDAIGVSDSGHSSVKRTIKAIKDKSVELYDVQVGDIIASKRDHRIVVITPNSTVFDAIKLMSDCKVGALVVTDPVSKVPLGIISERDYLNKIVLKGLSSKSTLVKDIMTSDIITTRANVSASKCMDLMTKGRFRHIPVVDDKGALIGLVSIGDLVKHVLDQQALTIEHMRAYIERTY